MAQPTAEEKKQAQQEKRNQQLNRPNMPHDEMRRPNCDSPGTGVEQLCCNDPALCANAGFKQPTAAEQQQIQANFRKPNCKQPKGKPESSCCSYPKSCKGYGFTASEADVNAAKADAPQPTEQQPKLRTANCDKPIAFEEAACCGQILNQESYCASLGFRVEKE